MTTAAFYKLTRVRPLPKLGGAAFGVDSEIIITNKKQNSTTTSSSDVTFWGSRGGNFPAVVFTKKTHLGHQFENGGRVSAGMSRNMKF